LPHGSARDGSPALQPIWLTHRTENPNGASMVVLLDGLELPDLGAFSRCAYLFDGNNAEAVEAARVRWRHARAAGHSLTYWQQTSTGWQRKS
jgi:DNA polymerase-3 subunit chi